VSTASVVKLAALLFGCLFIAPPSDAPPTKSRTNTNNNSNRNSNNNDNDTNTTTTTTTTPAKKDPLRGTTKRGRSKHAHEKLAEEQAAAQQQQQQQQQQEEKEESTATDTKEDECEAITDPLIRLGVLRIIFVILSSALQATRADVYSGLTSVNSFVCVHFEEARLEKLLSCVMQSPDHELLELLPVALRIAAVASEYLALSAAASPGESSWNNNSSNSNNSSGSGGLFASCLCSFARVWSLSSMVEGIESEELRSTRCKVRHIQPTTATPRKTHYLYMYVITG
jgi:hypothetical protein